MSLRIVLVNPTREPGGTKVYLNGLVNGLRARDVEVVEVGGLRALGNALRVGPDALVHAVGCLPSAVVLTALSVARARGSATVWTPIFHPSRPRTYGRSVPHVAMRVFDRYAPRLACISGAVIALTEEEQLYFRDIVGRDVELIPPGTDGVTSPVSDAGTADFRARHGLDSGPIVLVLGRSSPRHKGLAFCLDTFADLRAVVPDAQLVFVGGLGAGVVADRVHALGWVSDADRDAALAAAAVVFVPSAYEALSIAVIEAWTAGVPVVATDRVALAPLVEREHAGWVVPFGNRRVGAPTLAAALRDTEARAFAVSRGRTLAAERFANDAFVDNTLDVYERLVSARAAG